MPQKPLSPKLSQLFWVLSGLVIGNAVLAELLGMKIFSLARIFDIPSFTTSGFLSLTFDFNMSVGILIWPFVFVISDLINEYFGKAGVRKVSFFTAAIILYGFIFIYFATSLPGADFWLQINNTDNSGVAFDISYAYNVVFRQSAGIILGSVTAFLLSQLIDAYTFQYLKNITGHKKLWLRATGSTVISQFVDSFVILFIAFYILGNWSMTQVITVGIAQYLYKIIIAIVLTPVIYLAHHLIDKYLGNEHPGAENLQ
ncbi:MAG: queuosine precursor transporter [Bacteroidales bacterium]|nr:queuosine precursor transporter [Bacteroidales bacterium]